RTCPPWARRAGRRNNAAPSGCGAAYARSCARRGARRTTARSRGDPSAAGRRLAGPLAGNAHVSQMSNRADAGAQQMRRRMDRAAGQHDLAAAELLLLAIDHRLHADAARALEQQFLDLRSGRDREVGAFARVAVEIAHCGRDARLVLVGMGDREIAVGELAVLVGQKVEAGLLAGFGYRV